MTIDENPEHPGPPLVINPNDPSCIQWPVIVRPLAYYLDGSMTDPETFAIMKLIQPLSFRLSDRFVRIVG